MAGKQLDKTKEEKDLGIYINKNLKPGGHVGKVAAKANQMLGRLKHTFTYMEPEMFKAQDVTLVAMAVVST